MKKIIKFGSTLLLGAALLAGCGKSEQADKNKEQAATNWQQLVDKGEVVVGLDDTFVPMGFRDEQDNLVGFDIDLAEAVFEYLDIPVKFQTIDWSMKETELNNGTIDMIWNGYTRTPDREEKVLFTNDYIVSRQIVVTRAEDNITDAKGLTDKTIGVQLESTGQYALNTQPTLLKDMIQEAVEYDTFSSAFLDLEAGRLSGVIVDEVFGNYYIENHTNSELFSVFDPGFDSDAFSVGIYKNNQELADKINEAFKALYAEGKMQEISQKWFGEDLVMPQK